MNGENLTDEEKKAEIRGGRNLALLAVGAVLIALVTTVVSVYMYVSSGDIYLDRSLPGMMPEEDEWDEGGEEPYVFPDLGGVDAKVLDEFLKHFDEIEGEMKEFAEPFADQPISDEDLILIYGRAASGE